MTEDEQGSRRRRTPALAVSGAAAAAVLVLGVTGTLSSWTTAIITNDTNTTKAVTAVALTESDGSATTCADTSTTADNTATCSSINKYGGTSTPLNPDGVNSHTTTVTLTNVGTESGGLTVSGGTCTNNGGAVGATLKLCNVLTVTIACPSGTQKYTGTLADFAAPGEQAIATLAPGGTAVCDVTVTLPKDAPSGVSAMDVSQPITWTLTAS
ncbi:MAG: hypothetical protein ACTHJH_07615 [Marmoricola sp.]